MFNKYLLTILIIFHCFTSGNYQKNSTISDEIPIHGIHWKYGQNWALIGYKDCSGDHQSPIKINSGSSILNNSLHLNLENYDKPIGLAFIENNGHTVQIGFSDEMAISISGSATNNERYIFEQMHFHWGSNDKVGSEHVIDGMHFPMEMHLVHYKESYGSFDEAVNKPDGLVVIAALYKISSRSNIFLQELIQLVKYVPSYMDKMYMSESFTLRSLLPKRIKPFYQYSGSLSYPPCYESVSWIVLKTPINISEAQERAFRKCRGEEKDRITGQIKTISNNFRRTQAINDRIVFMSF